MTKTEQTPMATLVQLQRSQERRQDAIRDRQMDMEHHIVVLSRKAETVERKLEAVETLEDTNHTLSLARKDITNLKREVKRLQERVEKLENPVSIYQRLFKYSEKGD